MEPMHWLELWKWTRAFRS